MKTATLTFDIGDDGISNIRVTAADEATRARAVAQVLRALPSLELLENLLADEPPQGDSDGRGSSGNTAVVG